MALTKVQIRNIFENAKITIDDMEAVASSPKLKGFDSIVYLFLYCLVLSKLVRRFCFTAIPTPARQSRYQSFSISESGAYTENFLSFLSELVVINIPRHYRH